MKKLFIFVTLVLTTTLAQAAPYTLVNMGPDFKIYVNQYRNSSMDEKWLGWKKFESKYTLYFENGLCESADPVCEQKKKTRLEKFFEELPKFETKMWALFANAPKLAESQVARFKKSFPDLQDDIPVVFMPSLLSFNGKGVNLPTKSALMIGVDFTTLRGHDLNVLFSHEFFHVYQFNKLRGKTTFQTFSSPLWFEGLATWVSLHLNPTTSDIVALMNQELGDFCAVSGNTQKLAKEYSALYQIPSEDPRYDESYKDWFTAGGATQPARRGYCLGLAVIREVTKKKTLAEITSLDESGYNPIVLEALTNLAK
jgi:hypothetical protein